MDNFKISRKDLKQCNYNDARCEDVKENEAQRRDYEAVAPEVMLAIILFDLIKAGDAE